MSRIPWQAVPESFDRRLRGILTTDRCMIHRTQFCIRGRVDISVADCKDFFIWGIWVSVSREAYDRISELWNTEIREHEPAIPHALQRHLNLSEHHGSCVHTALTECRPASIDQTGAGGPSARSRATQRH